MGSSIPAWRCVASALRPTFCGVALVATFVSAACAQQATLKVSGVIRELDASCDPYAGWCEFAYWTPPPQFAAKYPIGMPLTITHTVDLAAPDMTADSQYGFYNAVMSTTLEIAGSKYEFNPGWVRVELDRGTSVIYDYSRFSVGRSAIGTAPEVLNWSVSGNNIYADDSIPLSPQGVFDAWGAVKFSNYVHVVFNVTSIRQVPEPSTWMIFIGAASLLNLRAARPRCLSQSGCFGV